MNQKIVCTSTANSQGIQERTTEDLLIRLEDHLLAWELFCFNVGRIVHSSGFQHRAIDVVQRCSGHLLAVVLMARALKMAFDVCIWQHASYMQSLSSRGSQTVDNFLCSAVAFLLGRSVSGSADECVKYCAFYMEREGMDKVDLFQEWSEHALISTFDDGEKIVGDLVSAFLLESSQNGSYSVRMRDEIREVLVNPHFLFKGGKGVTKAPEDEAWEEAFEIHLMNNKFSQLPNSPNCPQLGILFLQDNHLLRVIPPLFFQHMPMLQILDLSHTKIRSLPESLYGLAQLERLFLGGCKLFMVLPPEVGKLHNLKVLDLEGTQIKRLPVDVGKLTNLTRLNVSFYGDDDDDERKDDQYQYYSNRIIPRNVLSNLLQLEELSIDVNPNDKRWNANVKDTVEEVCRLDRLNALQIYLPEVLLLNDLWNALSSRRNISGMHFKFTTGSHVKRIISRAPLDIAAKFGEQQERCLKYVNGEVLTTEIQKVLNHATALFLDRHSTATSLSEFGMGSNSMSSLKFCVLGECDEIQTVIDSDTCFALESLEYMNLHYMKNLSSIWKGQLQFGSLSCLKVLALYTCPQLTTIFTLNMVVNLNLTNLEELVVEDCPKIESLIEVTHDHPNAAQSMMGFLKLKKISLHYMPRLVSISNGLIIPPMLEWMSFYDCPSLKTLYPEEVHSNDLQMIIRETKWWEEFRWNDSECFALPNLDAIFFPIEWDKDLRTQLADINVQHQARMKEIDPSQQPGLGDLKAAAVEDTTSSKQKQVA